jgi:transcriptional antiterminator RfaH
MNQPLDKKWCIAQIKPNSYRTATQNLEQQGFETFDPIMQITQRTKDKFHFKNVRVFPGYLFVLFDPNINTWSKINSTYGVSKILTFNKKPSKISSDLILELKNRYEINSKPTQKEKLKKGDSIKFYMGPFTDLIAKVESIDAKNRIWVLLEAMGSNKRIKIQNIEKNQYSKF